MSGLPTYDELPVLEPLGLPHAWEVFDPNLGTVALSTPAAVLAAAGLIRTGEVFNLNLPLNEPDPPLFGREPYRHEIFFTDRNHVDDRLDAFYPQGSSQWDGLR
ncbi:MAG: cyclase family protein, partial [Actinomycetota bacterium]